MILLEERGKDGTFSGRVFHSTGSISPLTSSTPREANGSQHLARFLFRAFVKKRAIWREAFGEEMPAEVATESWIDMEAVRDKEMREEFVSPSCTSPYHAIHLLFVLLTHVVAFHSEWFSILTARPT